MNTEKLLAQKEYLASKVHDAWWDEKKSQGFHPPIDCPSNEAARAWRQVDNSYGYTPFPKRNVFCAKCHADMYPYEDLPENIKDYDRATVDTVLSAIVGIEI